MRYRVLAINVRILFRLMLLLVLSPSPAITEINPSFQRNDLAVTYPPELFLLEDFNKDGNIDLVSANKNGGISLFFGNGDGTFREERMMIVGNSIFTLIADDFNVDGNLDILVNGWIYFGDGKGDFKKSEHSVGLNEYTISGDVNNDGIPDLAVGSQVYPGNGDGSFRVPITIAPSYYGFFTPGRVDDFNGDGIKDIIATYIRTDVTASITVLSIFYGNQEGSFTEAMIESMTSFYAYFPSFRDFNNGGRMDILWVNGDHGDSRLYLNNGDGNFTFLSDTKGNIPDSQFCLIFPFDFNHDKNQDLGVLSYFYNTQGILSFFPGKGDGAFGERILSEKTTPFQTIGVNDLNNDGLDDFILGDDSKGLISVYINRDTPTDVHTRNIPEFVAVSPNPANLSTTITYSIKSASPVKLSLYSVAGQKVATLVDGRMNAGKHSVVFDCRRFASGVYLYRFESIGFKKSGKMLLLK